MLHATLSHADAAGLLLSLNRQFQEQPVFGNLYQLYTRSDEPVWIPNTEVMIFLCLFIHQPWNTMYNF